jgi:hypothetical protein
MAIGLELERTRASLDSPTSPSLSRRRRRGRALRVACLVVLLGGGTYLTANERQANTQTDQVHVTMAQVNRRTAIALRQLATVRGQLADHDDVVTAASFIISTDTIELQTIAAALATARADAATQAADITNLATCQNGVQQALNALSVGDQSHALGALSTVSTACQSVDNASA